MDYGASDMGEPWVGCGKRENDHYVVDMLRFALGVMFQ